MQALCRNSFARSAGSGFVQLFSHGLRRGLPSGARFARLGLHVTLAAEAR